jgi:hypothetical protein
MIKYIPSFLNTEEIKYFIELFNNKKATYIDDEIYKFYYVDLINHKLEIEKFSNFNFKKFRVQMLNETIKQVELPHGHLNPWSFIIFLNENFIGGEIYFGKNIFFPKKGDMIYFSGNELHNVNNCIGDRYTLVGFMLNNPLNIEEKKYNI